MASWYKRQGKSPDGKAWAFSMHTDAKFADLFEEIFTEKSDRTMVIISQAYVEDLLLDLLKNFLVDDEEEQRKVFAPTEKGELSTFTAKVNIAFLLGLLSKDTCKSLKKMARIRNTFAHNYEFRSFQDLFEKNSGVKKELLQLMKEINQMLGYSESSNSSDGISAFRSRYEALFMMIQSEIVAASWVAKQERRKELPQKRTQISIGRIPNE